MQTFRHSKTFLNRVNEQVIQFDLAKASPLWIPVVKELNT